MERALSSHAAPPLLSVLDTRFYPSLTNTKSAHTFGSAVYNIPSLPRLVTIVREPVTDGVSQWESL